MKAQSRTMNRGQRGSGCSFMIAPRIIEASKGKSEPEWLETRSARPWEGTLLHPVGVDPPPEVVEELEPGIDGLRELLVESPLVLVVARPRDAGEAASTASRGAPSAARPPPARRRSSGRGRPRSRAHPAQEVGDPAAAWPGLSARLRRTRLGAHRRAREAPGEVAEVQRGADAPAPRLGGEVAHRVLGVEPRFVADLGEEPAVVDPPSVAQQPHPVAVERRRRRAGGRGAQGAARRAGAGSGTAAAAPGAGSGSARSSPSGATLTGAPDRVADRGLERAGGVRRRGGAGGAGRSRAGSGRPAGER